MANVTVLDRGTNKNGFKVRLQKRVNVFDVVYHTGFVWKYVSNAKAVDEHTARNIFFFETLI